MQFVSFVVRNESASFTVLFVLVASCFSSTPSACLVLFSLPLAMPKVLSEKAKEKRFFFLLFLSLIRTFVPMNRHIIYSSSARDRSRLPSSSYPGRCPGLWAYCPFGARSAGLEKVEFHHSHHCVSWLLIPHQKRGGRTLCLPCCDVKRRSLLRINSSRPSLGNSSADGCTRDTRRGPSCLRRCVRSWRIAR